jgi:hypothetical protein
VGVPGVYGIILGKGELEYSINEENMYGNKEVKYGI